MFHWCLKQTALTADSAATAERVEDENCNGDMESMEMDMDSSDGTIDIPAMATDAVPDVSCSHSSLPVTSSSPASSSTSDAVDSLSWFVTRADWFHSVAIAREWQIRRPT